MMKKLMNSTVAAAGFAALLLVGACASSKTADAGEATRDNDDLVQVTQTNSVVPAAGPALVDSDGNVYSSSAAPGAGNSSSVGTNTNVNMVPDRGSIDVSTTSSLATDVETPASSTTMTTRTTTTTPMTSSAQSTTTTDDDDTTAMTETTTRTRMRKD